MHTQTSINRSSFLGFVDEVERMALEGHDFGRNPNDIPCNIVIDKTYLQEYIEHGLASKDE